MERSQLLDAMSQLKLDGDEGVYDKIITSAAKRHPEPQKVIGDLLQVEISEKQTQAIKAGGGFLHQQRNVALIGDNGRGEPRTCSVASTS